MIPAAVLDDILDAATLAPSPHNSQPWSFAVQDDVVVELLADRSHALPVNDPHDRELVISCGAALLNLRIAAEARGMRVDLLCGPTGDLLARVRLTPMRGPARRTDPGAALAAAIPVRHTHTGAFLDQPVPAPLLQAMSAAAEEEQAHLALVGPGPDREAVADLVDEGDRRQFADPAWRRELAAWLRPSAEGPGLRVPRVTGALTRLVITHVDLGRSTGLRDAGLTRDAPSLALVWTDGDGAGAWLAAGQAMERALLLAAAQGVMAGFANQPCQVDALRPQLARAVGVPGHPQVVLRLGYPMQSQIQDFHHMRRAQSSYGMTSAASTGQSQKKLARTRSR